MFGPEVIGGIIAVGAATVGIAYRMYTSGGTAEADLDSDGNPELSVSTDDESSGGEPIYESSSGQTLGNSVEGIEFAGGDPHSPPERVKDVGNDLKDITGVGKTRAQTFKNEGFLAASDLYYASDKTLLDIKGIGDHALSQIRGDIGGVDE